MKKTNNKILFFILVNILISIIYVVFLCQNLFIGESNSAVDKGNIYPDDSTQFSNSDINGNDDNSSIKNPDDFSHNQSNWNDIDNDGFEDDVDIYDFGNAGIKVYIKSFSGDGIDYTYYDFKVPWDTSDPFFEIELSCYNEINETWEKIGHRRSKVYWDKSDILDPLYLICDVEDDTTEILVKIFAKDYVNIPDFIDRGRIPDSEEPIDISNSMIQDYCSVYFYTKQNTYKEFSESGNDNSDTIRKGSIEFYIEVVEI